MQIKKRIGLDFDDVLYDFNGGLLIFHNEIYGTSLTLKDITQWDFKELWQCDAKEAMRRMREFVTSKYHDLALPIQGATEAVKYLKIKHDLFVVTARDESLITQTHQVTSVHFPNSFNSFHFLHKDDVNVLGTKGEVCLGLNIELMVEDSLLNAEDLSSSGIRTLLFDTPWNQTKSLPKHVTRVFGWKHALLEIEKEG